MKATVENITWAQHEFMLARTPWLRGKLVMTDAAMKELMADPRMAETYRVCRTTAALPPPSFRGMPIEMREGSEARWAIVPDAV